MIFEKGDIVTRDGTDEQIVEEVYYHGDMLHVRCIKEPDNGWIRKNETEHNLAKRYSMLRKT
jgi:hypothetical protein